MSLWIADSSDNLRLIGTGDIASNKNGSNDVEDAKKGYCMMKKGTFVDRL